MAEYKKDPPGTGFVLGGWGTAFVGAAIMTFGYLEVDVYDLETAQQHTAYLNGGALILIVGVMVALTGHLIKALKVRE